MKVFMDGNIPVKSWCELPEEGAIKQAINLSKLPFAYHHIALMPDTHQGYGMPIGGVLATTNVIVPNAVGVDIGCGMLAARTNLSAIGAKELINVLQLIRESVPVGFKHNKRRTDIEARLHHAPVICQEYESAQYQVGSLGGGNHFIEIQKGDDGFIWFMIHSGSRNLGKKVCDYYNKIANDNNERWFSSVPKEWDLAFLPANSEDGKAYIAEMEYCQRFALQNRKVMQERIEKAFVRVIPSFGVVNVVNINHNYARQEHHFGKNVWVHRKGATSAYDGETGIIPGSQGTKSYIVTGKGNPNSFMSCSHGAGRRMGRKEAQRVLILEDEIKLMNDQGIIHGIRNVSDLDEAAGAYKDINVVMSEQQDLVSIKVELSPIAVIKG